MAIEIIPVLDLRKGKAVRAHMGEREKYRELCSALNLVEIYKNNGFKKIYIADLDAIVLNSNQNFEIIKQTSKFIEVMVDLGVKNYDDYLSIKKKFENEENIKFILGTETYDFKNMEIPEDTIISIDAKNGEILNFNLNDIDFTKTKNEILCIDLNRIGTKNPNIELCKKIYSKTKRKIIYGGGVTTKNALTLEKFIKGALIGSEIYDKFLHF